VDSATGKVTVYTPNDKFWDDPEFHNLKRLRKGQG